MKHFSVGFFVLCMATAAWGQSALEKEIAALRNATEDVVAIRPMTFSQAIKFAAKEEPIAVEVRGELDQILGDVVLMLRPIEQTSVARIPAILSDPSDPAQQATYRIGDRLEVTGMLVTLDPKGLPTNVASHLNNIDLSAYAGEPALIVTRLISMPPAEETETPADATGAAPAGATGGATGGDTDQPQQQPQPQSASAPAAEPEVSAPDSPTEAPAAPEPAREVVTIIREVPMEIAQFVSAPLQIVENPERFIGKTVTFDAITDDAPGEWVMRLIFDIDSPDDHLLAIRSTTDPLVEPGARVRVTGSLTTLTLEEIEDRAGIVIDHKLWLDDVDAPKFLIDSLEVLQADRFDD